MESTRHCRFHHLLFFFVLSKVTINDFCAPYKRNIQKKEANKNYFILFEFSFNGQLNVSILKMNRDGHEHIVQN